jgi:16S rRNA (cytosine967-C5)-methyltransferase
MRPHLLGAGLARTTWAPGAPVLAASARALDAVVTRGQSADAALAAQGSGVPRGPVQAITLGTLRWYLRLTCALSALLERPGALPSEVRALLAVGAHQIEYSRNAAQVTVHACVDAVRALGAPRSAALVNAVLRRFVAERVRLLAPVDADLGARTAHPSWLVERIRAAWPEELEAVLRANNVHPPMTLRVDRSRASAEGVLKRLSEAGIEAHAIQWLDSGIVLTHPVGVSELPGFAEGILSVQDAGAQLAAPLLGVRPGMRVLDACAAPGGKTGHLLEVMGEDGELVALDDDAGRVALIAANLERLKRRARLVVGDAGDPATFWDGRPFERILIDAPCSSTGVIRRHPDIKLLRRPGDIAACARQQLRILSAAAGMLAPGGRVLYSTCSILPEENEAVIQALLAVQPGLVPVSLGAPAPGAQMRRVGAQLLPGAEAGTDGFYYACLEKTTTGT